MKKNETKQKVMAAACMLFYVKGYHGTSVRDIAKKASVNVSLINYYFASKQGLLESAVVNYYEDYIEQLEFVCEETKNMLAVERLKKLIEAIIQYKQNQHQFSCFIQRELSIDSVFVREMMVTYLAKENHIISSLFNAALQHTSHSTIDKKFLLLQLKGQLITPYMAPNEWRNEITWDQSHDFFIKKYTLSIHRWIDYLAEIEYHQINNDSNN
ncbi:forespore capture DNA-binding protein RefZ [Aquibacillus saliphilus]|uniref:forespore capture DNA-binding protein RefZ n=1 Tax=Aquibacillus saliphilus TaxID=1909422 RepID=UPI001CF03129|nr:forespore capture DNA-binding protein RefZ [Aquibacillus saliphilus]